MRPLVLVGHDTITSVIPFHEHSMRIPQAVHESRRLFPTHSALVLEQVKAPLPSRILARALQTMIRKIRNDRFH